MVRCLFLFVFLALYVCAETPEQEKLQQLHCSALQCSHHKGLIKRDHLFLQTSEDVWLSVYRAKNVFSVYSHNRSRIVHFIVEISETEDICVKVWHRLANSEAIAYAIKFSAQLDRIWVAVDRENAALESFLAEWVLRYDREIYYGFTGHTQGNDERMVWAIYQLSLQLEEFCGGRECLHIWSKFGVSGTCKCFKCGTVREIGHWWHNSQKGTECVCVRCGKQQDKGHRWFDANSVARCKCYGCGQTRDFAHWWVHPTPARCKCVGCDKIRDYGHFFSSGFCVRCNKKQGS